MSEFTLFPYPVSANKYWRRFGHSMVISKEAKDYKQKSRIAYRANGGFQLLGDVAVDIMLLPKLNKNGTTCKVVMDLDNCIKITLDAMNGVAYIDDKQVKSITVKYGKPCLNGGLMVKVADYVE